MGSCTFHPGMNSIRLQPLYTRLPPLSIRLRRHYTRLPKDLHPAAATLHPVAAASTGCITSGTLVSSFYPDVSHPEFWPSDVPHHPDVSHPTDISGWGKRAFQLPRSDIFGSTNSAHPKDFAAILHSAAVFSWSFPICATDIFRYLSLDILF